MTRFRSRPLTWALASSLTLALVASGCRSSGEAPDVRRGDGITSAEPADGAAGEGGSAGAGLPCDVAQLLASKCAGCHSAKPSAPMALVTFADLTAPARSDPSRRVFEVALERITSADRPMPPSAPMAEADVATFAAWARAGAPQSTCEAAEAGTPRAQLPECVLASDCPGDLICRGGSCDVECVTDKDCAPTWSCTETRCHPPLASGAGDAGAPVSYGPLESASSWTTGATGLPSGSYSGTVFDGRYVYFAPDGAGGAALRYDTTVAFDSTRAWTTFDLTGVDASARGYRGAVFDGRYVYLVPSTAGARLARFDTRAPYLDAASWTIFDLKTVTATVGFSGATFDGRYLYLVPASAAPALRYDTAGAMASPSSWSTFAIPSVDARARSFVGAVHDGRYVYYVPNTSASGPEGVIARYDAEGPFGAAASWTTVDLAAMHPSAAGYRTGAFDGRYLYLVPGWTAPTPTWSASTVARYDTRAAFAEAGSWSFFDTTAVDPSAAGFNAAAFDGRRLVLAPGYNGSYHGHTVSFDTQRELSDTGAWSTFDAASLGPAIGNLRGAAFDGKYVYFAPSAGVALRFQARDTATASPPGGGSFY